MICVSIFFFGVEQLTQKYGTLHEFVCHIYCETITITLVNIHPRTKLQEFFSLVKRTFTAYSLSTFQIYNTVLSAMVTKLHITSSEFTHLLTEVCIFWSPLPIFPFPYFCQLLICSLFLWVWCFKILHVWDHTVLHSVVYSCWHK